MGKITISIKVPSEIKEGVEKTKEVWQDIGKLFVQMASEISQSRLDAIIKANPKAMLFIDCLPEA